MMIKKIDVGVVRFEVNVCYVSRFENINFRPRRERAKEPTVSEVVIEILGSKCTQEGIHKEKAIENI